MDNAERKRLAEKLHSANKNVISAKRLTGLDLPSFTRASSLIKEVIEALMDAPGMTDYYGNPTTREPYQQVVNRVVDNARLGWNLSSTDQERLEQCEQDKKA
jgi:hypothetical protein